MASTAHPSAPLDLAARAPASAAEARFAFGDNWWRFLRLVDERRVAIAEQSLREALGVDDLAGRRFLDVGSGSGLFSLAARRLGATVHSFDYDPQSVACAEALRQRFRPADPGWTVEQGSALDRAYLARLGAFDVVYSWGVLHHTGAMWDALANVETCVAPGGTLFIALYDDQGAKSRFWWWVKRIYVALPRPLRAPWAVAVAIPFELRMLAKQTLAGELRRWLESWTQYESVRGMSRWHDLLDWMGGFPFEVAKPADVERFYEARGYRTRLVHPTGGAGCVEYVFERKG
ncbi:MAG: class I SAM-dependent methyltransferase [Proteobacteria bacterium]|nr:MAG: class I SAM-dependent methyltransferase [Pseudomonadota bacterium]